MVDNFPFANIRSEAAIFLRSAFGFSIPDVSLSLFSISLGRLVKHTQPNCCSGNWKLLKENDPTFLHFPGDFDKLSLLSRSSW